MAARRLLVSASAPLALAAALVALPTRAAAQTATDAPAAGATGVVAPATDTPVRVPDVENSKYQFEGTINASSVLIRSGASDNFYATDRLDKGTAVTVVGIRFDWLKILPPPGSFSYVAKQFVEKGADGRGTVTSNRLNVRAGSTLSTMKNAIQTQLTTGDTVEILGEQDEYYKIKPPVGAYLYVNKQYVTPGRVIGEAPVAGGATSGGTGTTGSGTTGSGTTGRPTLADVTVGGTGSGATASGTGSTATAGGSVSLPTTLPVVEQTAAEKKYHTLEQQFRAAGAKPLAEQPINDLLAGYQSLLDDAKFPQSYKRIVQTRVNALKERQAAVEELAAAQKRSEEFQKRQQALQVERQELQQRLEQQQQNLFTAIGTLQTSAVQQGATPLFRLTDPKTMRTLVYLRSGDASLASRLGQTVGVRGEVVEEPSLGIKTITPTAVDAIAEDQQSKVAARIMPPSWVATTQASTPTTGQ